MTPSLETKNCHDANFVVIDHLADVTVMTISGATSDQKVGNMTTSGFSDAKSKWNHYTWLSFRCMISKFVDIIELTFYRPFSCLNYNFSLVRFWLEITRESARVYIYFSYLSFDLIKYTSHILRWKEVMTYCWIKYAHILYLFWSSCTSLKDRVPLDKTCWIPIFKCGIAMTFMPE